MNLAWIAAVLRPQDIVITSSHVGKVNPASWLAGLVLGDPRRLHYSGPDDDHPTRRDPALIFAQQSLRYETTKVGTAGLVREILGARPKDSARACALALFACNAAAEMDDYATCSKVLDFLLDHTGSDSDASRLIRAVLLQQKSLRLWDSGRSHRDACNEACNLLDGINVSAMPLFEVGQLAVGTSRETLQQVVATLRHGAWSLRQRPSAGEGWRPLQPWPDGAPVLPEDLLRIIAKQSETYASFVEQTYKNAFRSNSRYLFGGPAVPDLFAQTLALELLGHPGVREARKSLALLRLVQIESIKESSNIRDALRLLRHAGADSELNLAVERVRTAGPLWALSEDARQILRERKTPQLLRKPELRVLRGAAELMTSLEARHALDIVRKVLTDGGPANVPGRWQQDSERLGEAWLTGAALANAAGEPESMAEVLLEEVRRTEVLDDLHDRAIARAARTLDWERMPKQIISSWSVWWNRERESAPVTAGVVGAQCGPALGADVTPLTDLNSVAGRINAAIRGNPIPAAALEEAIEITKAALREIRSDAERGTYRFGALSVCDVAAGLIAYAGAPIWDDLASCLVDTSISRRDTLPAFERLADTRPSVPPSVAQRLRDAANEILFGTRDHFTDAAPLVPYPEALRFMAVYGLVDHLVLFSSVTQLAGDRRGEAREQAARTVARLAERSSDIWLLAVATQLSHDADPSVKAYAASALARLAGSGDEACQLAVPRVKELLSEDGVLVPFRVLQAMADRSPADPSIKREVERLGREHPSCFVRRAAEGVLAE